MIELMLMYLLMYVTCALANDTMTHDLAAVAHC